LKNLEIKGADLAGETDKERLLATKSLDQLANELADLPESSEDAAIYHAEIVRRQNQHALDVSTAQLSSETIKHSFWKILVLGIALLAMLVGMMFQS